MDGNPFTFLTWFQFNAFMIYTHFNLGDFFVALILVRECCEDDLSIRGRRVREQALENALPIRWANDRMAFFHFLFVLDGLTGYPPSPIRPPNSPSSSLGLLSIMAIKLIRPTNHQMQRWLAMDYLPYRGKWRMLLLAWVTGYSSRILTA